MFLKHCIYLLDTLAFLSASDTAAANSARFDGIRQRLRELGYIEGQNITIDCRSGGGKLDRHREVTADLVRLKVCIIVVGGGIAYGQAVKNATIYTANQW